MARIDDKYKKESAIEGTLRNRIQNFLNDQRKDEYE